MTQPDVSRSQVLRLRRVSLAQIAWEFFQIGLFAVGGGYSTLPFLQTMMGKYPSWFGSLQLADITAIAEATPGPVGINAATFAGYSAAGVPGALLATFRDRGR